MSPFVHRIYIITLFTLGLGIAMIVGFEGVRYYLTSPEERGNIIADSEARISDIDVEIELMREGLGSMGMNEKELRAQQADLRAKSEYWSHWGATGLYGHGLGIIGSLMMVAGVALYSTRKRIKRFRFTGKIKHVLEFHIFLCLLGPTLVVFHSTFKFGGIVSVSLWSMIFVALSGIFGRYIYTQIPKTTDGDELSLDELARENEVLRMRLRTQFHLAPVTLDMIDAVSTLPPAGGNVTVFRSLSALIRDDLTRRSRFHAVRQRLLAEELPRDQVDHVLGVARKKVLLVRKIAFFDTARYLFQYWHVIHLPFSIIMFLILIVHIALTVSLGYTWIF
ncbi:MAG: hypothetical protein IH600_06975 [Bacteroidetes bacterium]|nr:hypothetical protein [Bacteroidota bacterium]